MTLMYNAEKMYFCIQNQVSVKYCSKRYSQWIVSDDTDSILNYKKGFHQLHNYKIKLIETI